MDGTAVVELAGQPSLSRQPLLNVVPMQQQSWYDFDSHVDLRIGDFAGVCATTTARENGEIFWVAKVLELKKVA